MGPGRKVPLGQGAMARTRVRCAPRLTNAAKIDLAEVLTLGNGNSPPPGEEPMVAGQTDYITNREGWATLFAKGRAALRMAGSG